MDAACHFGWHLYLIQRLLEAGPEVDWFTPADCLHRHALITAVEQGDEELLQLLIDNGAGPHLDMACGEVRQKKTQVQPMY